MQILSFDHIHIYSKNPDESAKFYINHFEAEVVYQKEGLAGSRIFLSLGEQIIVLGPLPKDRSVSDNHKHHQHGVGLDHFGFRVKNLKPAVQKLKEQGVEVLSEPVKGSSGISYAFIKAPDGVIIELTEYGLLPKIYLKYKNAI